ncbi:unnamed protein product [Dibothriocephalus latus]|uniref:Uncharacterized protein n=1 Tax=Dibothriocephalus latus TaxID=60516 RepID=A0A3P7LDE6_DIBLA|nr:unnamed protein product [Dibothriocephalus latus]
MHINLDHPISLWPRAELFIYGVFQIQPLPRLASHNIKKLVYYAKSKGRLGYPNISYSVWKHVACNKLQLPESVAWLYFQTCLILSASNSSNLRELELTLAKAKDDSELEEFVVGSKEHLISVDAVEALSFVLEGTMDQMNSIRPVKDIIFDPTVLSKTGYNSSTRTFGIRSLQSWIRSCLIQNPFTAESCILRGTRLQWTLPGASGRENSSGSAPHTPTRRQRIATNAAHIPPTTGLRG